MENSLPKGWEQVSFDEFLDVQGGTQPPKSTFKYQASEGFIRLLQIRDFGDKPLPTYISYREQLKTCSKDDILIARYGASLGRIVTGKEGAYNVALAKVTIPHCIDKKYVYYLLKSELFQRPILSNERSAQDGFNKDDLKEIILPVPPFYEQKRISEKLERLLKRIANGKARLEQIPLLLKNMRQSILAAAVSGQLTKEWREKNKEVEFAQVLLNKIKQTKKQQYSINPDFKDLNDLPTTWKWTALGNYANCSRGRFSIRPRNDPKYFTGNYPFIQIGDLPREGGYITAHTQTLNNEGLKVSKLFKEGTVAIAIVGATIGNSGILSYDMCFTDSIVGIETDVDFSNIYVEYYLRSEKENIRQLSYASGGQPNINLETINTYPFPLPPLEEQKEIVRKVEVLFAFTDTIETRFEKAKAYFDKIPQAILSKAFKGELVKQDENDEPASELLKRIKQEKQATTKPKTKQPAKRYMMHDEEDDEVSMVAEGD